MNSDNSQQSQANWVQKRVRNFEGLSRARHVNDDQGNGDKPRSDYKRNSAPVVIPPRRSSLPKHASGENKKSSGLRPLLLPKSRSISPTATDKSQLTSDSTKSVDSLTARPEPPIRKSSLTSPNASRLISSRVMHFQQSVAERKSKSSSPSKPLSSHPSQDVTDTLVVKKGPSPTHVGNANAKVSSPSTTMPEGRPPCPSSKTAINASSRNGSSKGAKSSGIYQPSKPPVKPKPKPKATPLPTSSSSSKSKSVLKQESRPTSGRQTPESKLPVHVHSLSHSSSLRTEKFDKRSESPTSSSSLATKYSAGRRDSFKATELRKTFDRNKSTSLKDSGSKIGSPRATRKNITTTRSSIPTKSTMGKSSSLPVKASSIPLPAKPKPPPKAATKPSVKGSVALKTISSSASKSPSKSPVSVEELKSHVTSALSEQTAPTPVDDRLNDETIAILSPIETITRTEAATESVVTVNEKDVVINRDTVQDASHAVTANDEDIYDDVVQLNDATSKIIPEVSELCSNNASDKDNVMIDTAVDADDNIYDDVIHPADKQTSTESTSQNDNTKLFTNNDIMEAQGHTEVNDALHLNDTSTVPSVLDDQKEDDSLIKQNIGSSESQHSATLDTDVIYDDVVIQGTVTIPLKENGVLAVDKTDSQVDNLGGHTFSTNTTESIERQPLSVEVNSMPTVGKQTVDETKIEGAKYPSPHQHALLNESEAFYDEIKFSDKLPQRSQNTVSDNEGDLQVEELVESPRQSRVAHFQRVIDKNIGCRDSGLGIEAYYDKIDHSDDVILESSFYDQIKVEGQLETVSSSEDVLQTESSSEDVLVTAVDEPPALPPRSEDMMEVTSESTKDLTGTLLEVSTKAVEMTTAESGFEDQWFDSYYNEASRKVATRVTSKIKPEPLVLPGAYSDSPPPLPPRRPRSTQLDSDEKPVLSPSYFSRRASSGSPQVPLLPHRAISSPRLGSPKDFASSNSSLAPSHSAVSIISGRSEDRIITDGGSDASRPSSLVDANGELGVTDCKKEKAKFSLSIFSRKKKKADSEDIRPRASSVGQSLHRKKSSRQAVKKKGSVPPELEDLPKTEYSLPDPILVTGDKEYDDCMVIQNNWKSPPPDSSFVSEVVDTKGTPCNPTLESINDVGPVIQTVNEGTLVANKEIQKSMESLGSFTLNFEDSSGWFDDIYDMVATSTTHVSEPSEVMLTVSNTADIDEDVYDTVAPDLIPDKNKLGVMDSPNLNKRTSSSYDSSGSFDSFEDEDDHLAPLHSEISDSLKGHSLPHHPVQTKVTTHARPRSYSQVQIVKHMESTRRPTEEDVMETTLVYADAVWDYESTEDGDLKFHANDVIEIIDMTHDDWWLGYITDSSGWFPASYVRIRVGQEEVDNAGGNEEVTLPQLQRVDSNEGSISSGRSVRRTVRRASSEGLLDKKLSRSEYRAKIVEEIVTTERTYVKYLVDVVEGYLQRCLSYPHLFPVERIELIYSNIMELLAFQKRFLQDLETCVTSADMSQSQIGTVFLNHQTEFSVYSEYCNNHPYAVNEMNELHEDPQYMLFFESCRLLRNLGDLPLEAFLLKPVQKICKYPLQLSELLKYTDMSHPDYVFVEDAVEAMKNVAKLINNRKRRIENLYRLALWQRGIENWKGDHIVDTCSEEIFSGDLHKISKGHSQERHFTLFDHQLVYCKREAIGHKLQYRGRIIMDNCAIIDLADGEESYGGNPVKNAWKINNETKNKWYVLYSKDPSIKEAWMDAFSRERQRVQDDTTSKFNISSRLRRMAIAQADKSTKKEVKTKRAVLQESIDQYGIKQRSSSVFQASPNAPKKKGSKKRKTKRSAS